MNRPSAAARGRLPRPRKRFGQHFLVDRQALAAIADLARPAAGEAVLEVGPGRGALTRVLLERLDRLVAVEIDRDLVAHLGRELADPGLHLIEGDVLALDLRGLLAREGATRLVVVGNLPYNITAPVIFRMIEHEDIVGRAIFTLQREVAQRLVAQPGSRQYGLITVMLRLHAQARICASIDRSAFRPVPRVDSSVVEITFGAGGVAVGDRALFDQVARLAFQQRRKMLRNALKGLPALADAGTEALEARSGVDLSRRAETLSLEEFAALTEAAAEIAQGAATAPAGGAGEAAEPEPGEIEA